MKNKNQSLSQARPLKKRLTSIILGKALLLAFLLCQSNYLKAQNPIWMFKSTDSKIYKVTFNHRGQKDLVRTDEATDPNNYKSYVYDAYPNTRWWSANPSEYNYTRPLFYLSRYSTTLGNVTVEAFPGENVTSALCSFLEKGNPNTCGYSNRLQAEDFESIIVPSQMSCDYFLGLVTNKIPNTNLSQLYINPFAYSTAPFQNNTLVAPIPDVTYIKVLDGSGNVVDLPSIPSQYVKIAVSNRNSAGNQFLFMLVGNEAGGNLGGLYKFLIKPNIGTILQTNEIIAGLPGNSNPTQTFAQARILAPASLQSEWRTSELEVSPDGTQIAWADASRGSGSLPGKFYIANLTTSGTITGAVNIVTTPSISDGRINGLEFNPVLGSATKLYFTAGYDFGGTNDGLYNIDLSGSTYSASKLNINIEEQIAQSQIEANVNRYLSFVGINFSDQTRLVDIDPATNTVVKTIYLNPAALLGSDIRRLPRQIDGFHYNYNDIYGPAFVKTYSSLCPVNQYPAMPVSATQRYSVTPKPGTQGTNFVFNIYLQAGSTSTLPVKNTAGLAVNEVEFTFPTSPQEPRKYLIEAYYTDPVTGCTTQSFLTVSTGDGCIYDEGRIAKPAITAAVPGLFPNPAMDRVTVQLLPDEEQASIRITDSHGRLVKKMDVRNNAEQVDISSLANGFYFMSVTTPSSQRVHKILISK
jgi:hypothetical protein